MALDASAFFFSLTLALITGLIFGLVPAFQASRPALVPALKEDASSSTPHRSRLRAAFLVFQLALSLALLVGAGLALQSTRTLLLSPGFDAEHVAYFNLGGDKAPTYSRNVRRRLEALAVVESSTFAWFPPPLWFATADVSLPGQAPARPEDALNVPLNWVTPGFFETLHIPLVRGRGIESRDVDGRRRVVVVNQGLAHRLWSNADPIGETLMVRGQPFEVIGVAAHDVDARPTEDLTLSTEKGTLRETPCPRAFYESGTPRQAMALTRVIANQYADVPLATGVLSFAGGLALLLTAIGLYGVRTIDFIVSSCSSRRRVSCVGLCARRVFAFFASSWSIKF